MCELGYSCEHQHSRPSDIVEVAKVSKYYVPSLNSINFLDDPLVSLITQKVLNKDTVILCKLIGYW